MLRNAILTATDFAKASRYPDYLFRYNPYYYRKARSAFEAAGGVNESALTAELLARCLSWARRTAYGKSYGSDFSEWPILSKIKVRDAPAEFMRKRPLSVPASTSGTSGMPLALWRSLENVAAEQAFIDWLLAPNCPPMASARVAILRGDHVKSPDDRSEPYGVYRNAGRKLVLSTVHLGSSTISWFHNTLTSFRPEVLWVYPTNLAGLLHYLKRAKLELRVPVILSGSEVMPPRLRSAATRQLGAQIVDFYGQAERVCAGYSKSDQQYKFHPTYGKVELIPASDKSEFDNESLAKIVATGYWNSAMPLVRYDTGDFAILPKGCTTSTRVEIENGREPFPGVLGRQGDYIVSSTGAKVMAIDHIPRNTTSVLRTQVIQHTTTRIEVRVLCNGELTKSDEEALRSNARALLPPDCEVSITDSATLVRLSNGKTPFVIRKI